MTEQKHRTIATVLGVASFAVLLSVGYAVWQYRASERTSEQQAADIERRATQILTPASTDYIRGDPQASTTVIEYTDIECRYCKRFESTIDRLYQTYGTAGKVRFVTRHFPLGTWDHSIPEAVAVECAGAQKGSAGFYEYLDRLFALTPSENGLDPSALPRLAADLGLDAKAFAACTADPGIQEKVLSEHLLGMRLGIEKAPATFVIDPQQHAVKVEGNKPYALFQSLIEAALRATSTPAR